MSQCVGSLAFTFNMNMYLSHNSDKIYKCTSNIYETATCACSTFVSEWESS